MSSFGKELIMNKNLTVGNNVTIGKQGKTSRTTFEMLGADINMNIDASQSGDPGDCTLNMGAKQNKMKVRFEGLPIVTGATNTPPSDDVVPVNGLYGYRTVGGAAPAQIFMKMA